MSLIIRPVAPDDYAQWLPLWLGYLKFYRTRLDDSVTQLSWSRLCASSDMHAFVADQDGTLVGFTHYLFHANTWTAAPACYLEDLFVADSVRGLGTGRKLIQAVYEAADARGAGRTYWTTQEYNADARALYDTLATRTSMVQYRR